jgi:nicotinate-nucleotide--dimethylbenzimidazole phosphoribosyltransferase
MIFADSDFPIPFAGHRFAGELQEKINNKTKPLGALGKLENLALQIGCVQESLTPELRRPVILVFAGDHGIAREGVSAYPQEVTYQMVMNFLAGGAAINVFAKQNAIMLRIVDAGVIGVFHDHPNLIMAKIAEGTANFLYGPAMTKEQCLAAIDRGGDLARLEIEAGSNVLGFGEMGIGNTSSAAILMCVLCGLPLDSCIGRGTGLDDSGFAHKLKVLSHAVAFNKVNVCQPLDVLASFGGFEIAMMVGAMFAAAQSQALLLIDGFIATAALLVAAKLRPEILSYAVYTHCSAETGHRAMLNYLQADPLLELNLRLGEGSGCALAFPLLLAAVNFLNDMASFSSAGVSVRS